MDAIEVDVRHVLPHVVARDRALETRQVPAELRLVVDHLDPLRMLGGDEQESDAGRGLRIAHIHRFLADVGVQLDASPPENVGHEGIGALKEAELGRVGEHALPTPVGVLTVAGPVPGEVDRRMEGVEGDVKDDDHLGVVGEREGARLTSNPGELRQSNTLVRTPKREGLEDVRNGVEDSMDQLERRLFAHAGEHRTEDRGISVELDHVLSAESLR